MAPIEIVSEDPAAAQIGFTVIKADGISVRPGSPELWSEIEAVSRRYNEAWGSTKPSEIPGLRPARDLFKAAGIDPTRRRPASEALLRRVLQGKELYRINNAVDACNLCSLDFLLPIGLYDLDSIRGKTVRLRLGRPGESYQGIGKDLVTLDGQILLADSEGPFGNPSSDSFRTRVTHSTTRLLWVMFSPADFDRNALDGHAEKSIKRIKSACGGTASRA